MQEVVSEVRSHMKAKFIENVSNARLLRNRLDEGLGVERQYFIERSVVLKHHNFMYFRDHLSGENDIVKMHNKDMFVDGNGIWHVIMVCCVRSDIMILIFSDGTNYPKYLSIKNNGGEQVETKFTTCKRYSV